MSEYTQSRIDIVIHRDEDPLHKTGLGDVDFGPLLNELVTTPKVFANNDEGAISLDIRRTHEWELILGIILVGSTIFATSAVTELGKQFTLWLLGQVKKLKANPQTKIQCGEITIHISEASPNLTDAIVKLLKDGIENDLRVTIVIESSKN